MNRTTINEWFRSELLPVLNDAGSILIEEGRKKGIDVTFAEWWAVFIKDTVSLFEIFEKENQTRQFTMTVRSLMELAADVSFLAKYPKNIIYQKNRLNRFIANKKHFTYRDIAEEASKFKLREYVGNKQKGEVSTEKRIALAFNANGVTLYKYLNCFTHFNVFGIRIDLNIHQANDASMLSERLVLAQFYPDIFEIMTVSMGKICNIEGLKQYNFSKIKSLFKDIDKHWKLANS